MIFEAFVLGTVVFTVFSTLVNVPLYIAVMVIIVKYRRFPPFNSSFYSIFIALGVVDIVCYLLYAVVKKPIFWGYVFSPFEEFNQPNVAAKISLLTIWIFALLQYQYMCLLTLNRFAGICFPDFYFKYWTHRNNRYLIATPIFLTALLLYPCLYSDFTVTEYEFYFENKSRILNGGPVSITPALAQYFVQVWSMHIYALMFGGFILYAVMYIKAKVLFKTGPQANKNRLELRMLKQGAMVFSLNFCFCLVFFVRKHLSDTNTHLYEYLLLIVSDVYDLANGFILLLTSAEIRRKLRPARKSGQDTLAVTVQWRTRSTAGFEKTLSLGQN